MKSGPLRLVAALTLAAAVPAPSAAQEPPRPVRNDTVRAGTEFLVLRHQKLRPGAHQRFFELSRDGVWPFFEKIGARVVGQWQVVRPDGGSATDFDEGYRLARYRSYNHWAATRSGERLGGNGPDWLAMREAIAARRELLLGSDGPVYLEGATLPNGPYYHPGLDETYVPGDAAAAPPDAPLPVRHGRAVPGDEIVTLRRFEIRKGTFAEFHRLSAEGVWPYFEKMGARIVGQWRRVYPRPGDLDRTGAAVAATEPDDRDEVYMMARYASYEHWQATRPAVMAALGGNGPDYEL
ncbi:MAG: hypothetical protein R3190_01410, partial [Thermoanaerobaculia bacterium]|nr:hypothetical protein [Thermoanaerobaculia bacterium]